jgi:hypothetical protein
MALMTERGKQLAAKYHCGNPGLNERIILTRILKKYVLCGLDLSA